mmetsp:Transcript_210/g.597  ORF Transcript_210/g.597 Transcript_210/m.597 type:complete len:97 (-) Transcript_210:1133-1423(-)
MSSVCVPASTTFPWLMTTILSALVMVESRWAMTMVVRPTTSLLSASRTNSSLSESRAEVASSSTRTGASLSRARAMARRCFCPPEICTPRSPHLVL